MLKLNCPSCGAEVSFRSKASVFAVCSFCRSTLVRQDMNLKDLGKMAELQDDLTPLQIGTAGSYEGRRFDLVGRLKVGYADGFWNEWYALFNDELEGWLAEAQGFYAMCFASPHVKVPNSAEISVGRKVSFGELGYFEVDDMRQASCIGSEGELPLFAVSGRQSLSVDLAGSDSQMATIEYAERETRIFVGRYLDFDEFEFKNLREIDGW